MPRLVVVAALVVSVFALLLGRLGQVQVVQRTAYAGPAAVSLETRTTVQPAVRGRILDAQGEPLTDNTSSVAVTVERRVLVEASDGGRALVDRIAAGLDRPAQPLWERTFLCGSPGATPPPPASTGPHTNRSRSPRTCSTLPGFRIKQVGRDIDQLTDRDHRLRDDLGGSHADQRP